MKKLVIFSQAPADIIYVLSLFKRFQHSHKIKIIVVNVKNNYKFFQSLNLDIQLEFIPLIPQKKLFKFLLYLSQLRVKHKILFSNLAEADIYYFSDCYDYVTAFFIEKLAKNNKIHFTDLYNSSGPSINTTSTRIKQILVRLLLGIRVQFIHHSGQSAYKYLEPQSVIKTEASEIKLSEIDLKEFQYQISASNEKQNILFLESNNALSNRFAGYEKQIQKVFEQISSQATIYVKPHPRLGYSQCLEQFSPIFIDEFVPAEMLKLEGFSTIIAIESTAIATMKHPKKICVIDMFEHKSKDTNEKVKAYLDQLTGDEFTYVTNITDLSNMLKPT